MQNSSIILWPYRESKLYANYNVASHAKNKLKEACEILRRVPFPNYVNKVRPHLAQGYVIDYKQSAGTEEAILLPQQQRDAQQRQIQLVIATIRGECVE